MAGNEHGWVPKCPACGWRALDLQDGLDESVRDRLMRHMSGRVLRCETCRTTIRVSQELQWLPA